MLFTRLFSLHTRPHIRLLLSRTLQSSNHPSQFPKLPFFPNHHRFSTHNNNNNNGNGDEPGSNIWKISSENDDVDDIFGNHVDDLKSHSQSKSPVVAGRSERDEVGSWALEETENSGVFEEFVARESGGSDSGGKAGSFAVEESWKMGGGGDGGVFDEFEKGVGVGGGGGEMEVHAWKIEEEEGKVEDVFDMGDETGLSGGGGEEDEKSKEEREVNDAVQKLQLEKEEQSLLEVYKGPERAFGDLIAASGITDAMLDSMIALKNFQDIDGLPPLSQIEDERYEKTSRKSSRYEMEIQKQEDAAKARVRKVDEKGRAYGTGKRKCSIARVWIQPGEGKFSINDKEFDVYFPMLDHRAALLRPFSETKTVGLWDVKCTVKGGGTTGQVDAIRLGVSRALQNWEPGLRPPLREAGFLTRDPRIVERKKPGKAKARKSFQWVKR